ncbi:hypothetical protein Dimus_007759, partial [Dionaea muscipula]
MEGGNPFIIGFKCAKMEQAKRPWLQLTRPTRASRAYRHGRVRVENTPSPAAVPRSRARKTRPSFALPKVVPHGRANKHGRAFIPHDLELQTVL